MVNNLTLHDLLELQPRDIPDVVAKIFQDPDHWNWSDPDSARALIHTIRDMNIVRAIQKPDGSGEDSEKWSGLVSEAFGKTLQGLENVEKSAQIGFVMLLVELANYPQIWGYDPTRPNDYFNWAAGYLGPNAYQKYGKFFNTTLQKLLAEYMPGTTIPDVFIRSDGTLAPDRVAQLATDEIGQRHTKVTREEFIEIMGDVHDPSADQTEYKRRRTSREQRRTGVIPTEKGLALVLDRGDKGFIVIVSLRGNTITNGFMRHIEPYVGEYKNASSTEEVIRMVTE